MFKHIIPPYPHLWCGKQILSSFPRQFFFKHMFDDFSMGSFLKVKTDSPPGAEQFSKIRNMTFHDFSTNHKRGNHISAAGA